MDHDDDVEHLFSWLQTPELRYREFAGAREITDAVVIVHQQRANNTPVPEDKPEHPPRHATKLDEEYPEDQFPDQGETRIEVIPNPARVERVAVREEVEIREEVVVREQIVARASVREETRISTRGPVMIAPEPVAEELPREAGRSGLFALGAEGREAARPGPAEWAGPRPPLIQTPVARPVPPQPPAAPPQPPPPEPRHAVPASGGGLLGGAYRENGTNGHGAGVAADHVPSVAETQRSESSLDAVFGRLAGGRSRLPDPRERLRHIPGLGPPSGRPR